MTLLDAIPARHSVRAYTDRPIPPEAAEQLRAELQAGNQAGGLHMQLVTDDPAAFEGLLAHYGKFRGVRRYIGPDRPQGPRSGGKAGLLRGAGRSAGPDPGPQHLLGGPDLPQGLGPQPLSDRPRGKAGLCAGPGLWRDPGRAPQEQGPGGGQRWGGPPSGLVHPGLEAALPGSHGHEPAEIPPHLERHGR